MAKTMACLSELAGVPLLPRARSRALIPFPFPFERLPRRLPIKVKADLSNLRHKVEGFSEITAKVSLKNDGVKLNRRAG